MNRVGCGSYNILIAIDSRYINNHRTARISVSQRDIGWFTNGELQLCLVINAVFIIGIGGKLSDGSIHDVRAADYDDWSTPNSDGYEGLNGDILLWNPVLESAFEISSMGIRVDPEAMRRQLKERGQEEKAGLYFHRRLFAGELPATIGGGIGQSRLCMYLLRKAHIGEIQSSIWPEPMREACHRAGIELA